MFSCPVRILGGLCNLKCCIMRRSVSLLSFLPTRPDLWEKTNKKEMEIRASTVRPDRGKKMGKAKIMAARCRAADRCGSILLLTRVSAVGCETHSHPLINVATPRGSINTSIIRLNIAVPPVGWRRPAAALHACLRRFAHRSARRDKAALRGCGSAEAETTRGVLKGAQIHLLACKAIKDD